MFYRFDAQATESRVQMYLGVHGMKMRVVWSRLVDPKTCLKND